MASQMKLTSPYPILIASPVRRSGTTLLQRLLCSASNTLIYGETCANELFMGSNLLLNKQLLLQAGKSGHNRQLKAVLEGDVNDWIPDLMPEIDGYLQVHQNAFLSIIKYFEDFAKSQGRPIWGVKLPEWNPANLVQLHKMFPASKILYLHRNLEDCVRSARSMDMVINEQEIYQFCQAWKQAGDYAKHQLKGDGCLHLNFEDLVEFPEKTIAKIERFTGAENIDRSVMQAKINTYLDDPKLDIKEVYLKPSFLTAAELEIISTFSNQPVEA